MIQKMKDWARSVSPAGLWSTLRAYKQPLSLYQTVRFNFFPVVRSPLVIYSFTTHTLANVFYMSASLGRRQASFIVGFTRYPTDWKLEYLRRQFIEFKAHYPQNRIVFIANSREEQDRLKKYGFDASLINKNAFQREDQFTVEPESVSAYDAVMNASIGKVEAHGAC